MGKSKNPEIKNKSNPKGLANDSIKIKKHSKKDQINLKNVVKADLKTPLQKKPVKVEPLVAESGGSAAKGIKKHADKEKKVEENKESQKNGNTEKVPSELDLAKIEKKKAKKLAQKLKKKEKKAQNLGKPVDKSLKAVIKAVVASKAVQRRTAVVKTPDNFDKRSADTLKSKSAEKKQKKKEKKEELRDSKAQDGNEVEQKDRPTIQASTVFVGNLPINTKRVQLIKLFSAFAPVKSIGIRTASGGVIFKHKVRKQAGTLNAYVNLNDAETVARAVSALNGIEFKGNHLRVNPANKKCGDEDKHMIFVGNLKYSATEEQLREIFSSCGEIEYVRCLRDGEKGCNGVAYVCFKAPEAVGLALELNETVLDERPIHVERYSAKKLGAKAARDSAAAAEKTTKTGAKRRLDGKKSPTTASDSAKDKKKEFRGVKVDGGIRKKPNKKITNQQQQLAKKIAPKPK